jgi:hypothetical protein
MAALEVLVRPANRQMTQTFAMESGLLRKSVVDAAFKEWMSDPVVAGAGWHCHSVHSFRSYLATALAAQGASRARIQSMLRWASEGAVDIYQRTTEDEYSQWVRAAASADIETIMTHHLPRAEDTCDPARGRAVRYDSDELVGELSADMEALMRDSTALDAD